jgi:Tol biopolymer transport system component
LTSRGTWRRRSRSSSALLLAALVVAACGSTRTPTASADKDFGILFSRLAGGTWSTWFADADGSNARLLVKGVDGTLSPDGRWLVYGGTTEQPHLFLRELASGKTRDLGRMSTFAWAPDSSTLLAIWDMYRLVVIDPEGGPARQVADGGRNGRIWSASFSPDGREVVFGAGVELTKTSLFIARLADDRVSRLTDGSRAAWGKSWIAFSRYRYLNNDKYWSVSDLYLIRPDGSGLHRLTIKDDTVGHGKEDDILRFGLVPEEFSADGTRLAACVSIELGPCEPVTFTVPNGPGQKLDVRDEGTPWSARLAPDGSEVLFESGALDDEEHHTLSVIPFAGGKPRVLIRNAARACWAPIPPTRDDTY